MTQSNQIPDPIDIDNQDVNKPADASGEWMQSLGFEYRLNALGLAYMWFKKDDASVNLSNGLAKFFYQREAAAVAAAELKGLELIENAPRVPVELMSMVQRRKAIIAGTFTKIEDNHERT